jgi:ribosomal-protein-alanine N-acetyltransferase
VGRVDLPDGYAVRRLSLDDAEALATAYLRNREHLAPWDPPRTESFFTAAGQRDLLRRQRPDSSRSCALWWGAAIVGRANLNQITGGVFASASFGYWVDADHTGQGLGGALCRHACGAAEVLGLHRVEAGTMLGNAASQAVLRRCGFTEIGVAPRYLYLAGAWQDHLLFQRILHDRPPG